jgi:signal transduction histidine kinase
MYSSKKIWIIIIVLSTFIQIGYSQNIDSLLNVRINTKSKIRIHELDIQLAKEYSKRREWTQSETYLNEALVLGQSLNDNELIATAYEEFGRIAYLKGDYQKADSIYTEGLGLTTSRALKAKLYSKQFRTSLRTGEIEKGTTYLNEMRRLIGDDTTSVLMGEYYLNYSTYYSEQANFLKQLQYLQKSKKIYLEHDRNVEVINYNLSTIFEELKDYESALKIHFETKKGAKKDKNIYSELFSLFGIMSAQEGMRDYEAAKKTCHEAINLKNKTDISNSFGYVYYILGFAHLETERLDSAAYYFRKGIEISETQNEATQLGDNHSGMAKLFFEQKKLQEAKFHAKKARSLHSYVNTDNNTILAKIYAKEGDYQDAYDLLNINWSKAQKAAAERTDYQMVSTLLKDKFEQEKIQEQLLFQQKFNKQRQFLIGGILITGLILLVSTVLIQIRNNQQLKQLNEQLYQRNNALQQFSYIASHDIKEPMRSIGNYIGLIRRKLSDADKKSLSLFFDNIQNGLQQIYTLIEDVMQYTQVNQDETIKLKTVSLNAIIKNIEVGLESFIQEKGAKVIYSDLPDIESSSSMLFMILKNLIQNGIKFNRSEVPTSEISYAKTQTHHEITVSDNGIGIDESYHDKIFEMFKRLQKRTDYEGSGIGLSIVKLSVDKLGGEIRLNSQIEKGSQFIIKLPL